jgi:polysaccharide biosynthesis transport protein
MLQRSKPASLDIVEEGSSQDEKSFREIFDASVGFVRRQFVVILFCAVLAGVLGSFFLLVTPPIYTASATMIIDPRQSQLPQQRSVMGDAPLDSVAINSSWIDSQIGILRSSATQVATAVVKELNLAGDPEFTNPEGFLENIRGLLFGVNNQNEKPKTAAELAEQASGTLGSRLQLSRVGQSYLIKMDLSSRNRDKAVKLTNALAEQFIVGELEARYQAVHRATDWLQERLRTLHDQSLVADRAVAEFKAKNNMVSAQGRPLSEQEVTQLNGQLTAARAHAADGQAKLDRIEAVIRGGQSVTTSDATVSDALNNPIITRLRTQYLELANRQADLTVRVGRNHLAVVNIANQMRDIRKAIFDELARIAETYKSDLAIAKQRQDELEKLLADAVTKSQGTNDAQISLRALESSAQSYHSLYDNMLQHYTQSVQQLSSPITETRVVSRAGVATKTYPRGSLVMSVSIIGGLMLGLGLGKLREMLDRGFRTREQVQTALDTECIALLPTIESKIESGADRLSTPLLPPAQNAGRLLPIQNSGHSKLISIDARASRVVIDAPFSRFAEALRSIKLAADLNGGTKANRVIGLTSCLPGEGKSTISTAMATLIAQGGARTILLDCDLRNPTLSGLLTPDASAGLVEVLSKRVPLEEAICTEPTTGMSFLPTVARFRLSNTSQILGGDALKGLFTDLRSRYDYVIVDLSPLAPIIDVRATTHLVDSYVLLIEWARTPVDVVKHALIDARGVRENMLGAVLNKVDMSGLLRYEGYRYKYYRNKHFVRYGYTD